VEYGEKWEWNMEKTPLKQSVKRLLLAENSCQMAAWRRFFSALLGGIPRKKWAKQEVTLGVECGETPLFQWVECGERLRMQRRGLCPLSRYSISFLK
jgi:hypothetical protein